MHNIRLLSWNVNGLRAIYKKGFYDWLMRDMPDVLCLQETKVQADQIPSELKSLHRAIFPTFAQATKRGMAEWLSFPEKSPKA